VTVGVLHRVNRLADRAHGFRPDSAKPFFSLVPLPEVLAETMGTGVASKRVDAEYRRLIHQLGNEFRILIDTPLPDIERAGSPLIREAISRVRAGKVNIIPGFDGEYGKIRIFEAAERRQIKGQAALF
jgi:PHP family Zn ribbon phosphoesterase